MYEFYLADKLMEDNTYIRSELNAKSGDPEFTEIFGDNVKEEYKEKLQIINGKLVYKTLDADEIEAAESLGMGVKITPLSEVEAGAKVAYIPTANPDETFSGATYVLDNVSSSPTYNTYIEKTIDTYKPGNMTWVYLGQDAYGNILLTSDDVTSFEMTIGGQDGWVDGPDRMDTLCNTLYGNTTYAKETRNMKAEDVNRILGYNGPFGQYQDTTYGWLQDLNEETTFGDIAELYTTLNKTTPRKLDTQFDDYLVNWYQYDEGINRVSAVGAEKVLLGKEKSFWLSTAGATLYSWDFETGTGVFEVACATFSELAYDDVVVRIFNMNFAFSAPNAEQANSFPLRPVIVLKDNIYFGDTNAKGELTLVEM